MTIRIDGGTIVGWSGATHEIIDGGSVLIEGDSVSYIGSERRPADRVIDAAGKLVSPGFINLHVHSQLNVGDYLITDATKKDYLSANFFVFGAPVKEKSAAPPPPESVALGRRYALYSALRNGATTILDPGGGPGNLDDYVEIVGQIGARVFFSPPYRSHDVFTDAQGRHYYEAREDGGRPGLQRAADFIRKFNGAKNGRVQGILNPAQAETCEPSLLKETAAAAKELGVGIHTHAAGNLRELIEILYTHGKPAIEYLADAGVLGAKTILGHTVFITGHSKLDYPFGDELKLLADTGTSVGHCPHKYAKMANAAESFDRYVDAGVNMGLGTDTYPLDIVAEMRYASLISRLVDKKYYGARAARVFNAATVWGAKALGRDDLGKIAPGAKADIVIVNLRTTRYGPARDPINALVEYGCGADVETVIVNGEAVVEGGRSTRIDDEKLFAEAEAAAKRAWDNWPKRDWAGRSVEEINPPAFPTRKT